MSGRFLSLEGGEGAGKSTQAVRLARALEARGIEALVTRRFLSATKGGHEVYAGELLGSALSHASLLSLPYALDTLVPALEEALAGNGPVETE